VSTNDLDLEAAVRRLASDPAVLGVMSDLMAEHGEFDRALVASQCASTPRTLKRFCDTGLIEKESRPKRRSGRRIYYTMPRHAEIRQILGRIGGHQ
jgi:predicted transcriptional regulator